MWFTNTPIHIDAVNGAVDLVYKTSGASSVTVPVSSGSFSFTITAPGLFFWQQRNAAGAVLAEGQFEVKQDLASASASYDPRSLARKTLEALDDKIAGRALTIQQSKITVGDRSIEYINSIEELLKWRDHYARLVAKEEGRSVPKIELCVLRRA